MKAISLAGGAVVLPPLLDDELLASYWRRIFLLNYYGRSRALSELVLGESWRRLAIALPTHLHEFQATAGNRLGLGVQVVLEQHTLFNLYAAGLPHERQASLRGRMINTSPGPRLPCAPLHGIDQLSASVRTCVHCQAVSLAENGARTWQRLHNAPGIRLCPIHALPLVQLGWDGAQTLIPGSLTLTEGRVSNDMRLAAAYKHVLGLPAEEIACFKEQILRRVMAAAGPGVSHRYALRQVSIQILESFKAGFASEELTKIFAGEQRLMSAIGAMLASRSSVHPLWLALAHATLPLNRQGAIVSAALSTNSTVAAAEEELVTLLSSSRSLAEAAHASGVSVTTLSTIARRHGLSFLYRPSVMVEGVRQEALTCLENGMSFAAVAAKLEVGVQSIYRVLSSAPASKQKRQEFAHARCIAVDRDLWLAAVKKHPDKTRTMLRAREPALWARLYRSDRAWLMENQTPCVQSTRWTTRVCPGAVCTRKPRGTQRWKGVKS